jgi:Na+-driven multidrug efflux pump
MGALKELAAVSIGLGIFLGGLSYFIFGLSKLAAAGIGIATVVGMFFIGLILTRITMKGPLQ